MAKETAETATAEQASPRLQVIRQYIRDLSFENEIGRAHV